MGQLKICKDVQKLIFEFTGCNLRCVITPPYDVCDDCENEFINYHCWYCDNYCFNGGYCNYMNCPTSDDYICTNCVDYDYDPINGGKCRACCKGCL